MLFLTSDQSGTSIHPDVLPAYIPTYLLTSYDQAHSLQLGQTTLFIEVKTHDSLS